ncbi:flagellar hook-associated protein 2 [Cohnella sp. OV330]|uniref:flagellar filament capping protein FliD n=1 Tax=Cohnella sp. OV330 TaxID=1855288 RepID=UPI0008E0C437|nr:flagellar filament capping protein FliD [Cohnella sp. OV330]SFB47737.1 flagellar hook-associated protein 2 [Cohnella sp. OV330]
MVTRMSGLASGLDIDGIVTKLMKAERTSLDALVKKRTKIEWQQEAYRDINAKIVDFRNNKLANYSLSSSIGAKTSDVTGDTNAITVNSTSSSASGSMNISVDAVAKSAVTVYTYQPTPPSTDQNTSGKTLADLGFTGNTLTITQPSGGTATVTVDTSKDTLATLAAKINANKSANATASYNDATGQFSLVSKSTGAGEIKLDIFGDFAESANAGSNAKATINGIAYEQASNTFDMNGFNFTVRNQTGSSGSTTVSIKTDTDKILSTIKSFINDYNTLIGAINGKLGEKSYRDYMPLTDVEKGEMKESQITLWEEKAHSGLLKNDSILSGLVSQMRIATMADYTTKTNLTSIGITTGDYTTQGKLVIQDESKLKDAIEADPQKIIDMFTKAAPTGTKVTADMSGVGIFQKLTQFSMTALKQISEKAGTLTTSADTTADFIENSLLSDTIRSMKDRETDLAARLSDKETQYYKKFTAMETAINKMNTQSSSLSSFMS